MHVGTIRGYPAELGNILHEKKIAVPMVSLFVWSFSSHSKSIHSFGDVTIAGEGLQILTYAWH